jgi:hypothetical protein
MYLKPRCHVYILLRKKKSFIKKSKEKENIIKPTQKNVKICRICVKRRRNSWCKDSRLHLSIPLRTSGLGTFLKPEEERIVNK